MKISNPGDDALSYIKADRTLISALRETQADHGGKLTKLLEGQGRLEVGQRKLIDGQVLLEDKVVKLQVGQTRLETSVKRLTTDVETLKTDVSQLKTDVSDLKQGQARLEALVRKGFGMDSEN